jgi:hypothetical protein
MAFFYSEEAKVTGLQFLIIEWQLEIKLSTGFNNGLGKQG